MSVSKEGKKVLRGIGAMCLRKGHTFKHVKEVVTKGDSIPFAMLIRQGYLMEQTKYANN